jgi:hypothetical protein
MIATTVTTSILVFIYLMLSIRVVQLRRRLKIGVGDGGEPELQKAIRVHANFAEYVPLALLTLALFEYLTHSSLVPASVGGLLVVARLLHAYGLGRSRGVSVGRFYGTALTWLIMLGLAVANMLLIMR